MYKLSFFSKNKYKFTNNFIKNQKQFSISIITKHVFSASSLKRGFTILINNASSHKCSENFRDLDCHVSWLLFVNNEPRPS